METVKIFDTTLRDGEQSPGISLDVGEKLEIAEQLARLGVDIIEAGLPDRVAGRLRSGRGDREVGAGPDDRRRCRAPRSRTSTGRGRRCGTPTKARIHIFIATSKIHMEKKLRMTPEQVKAEAAAAVGPGPLLHRRRRVLARGRLPLRSRLHVRGLPDRGRQRRDDAEHPRHGRLRGSRGLRQAHPVRHRPRHAATSSCRRTATTTSGLAVANSLAGVANGARQVECAVNGLGERAGNAALEEVVMAIKTRGDYFDGLHRERAHRGARPHVPARLAPHRLPRAVQQGGRRAQRVRARGRHPPARRARPTARPTRSSTRRSSARKPRRSCSASTPAGTRSPTRSRRWACTCRATRSTARSCASRSSPTRRSRSPRPTSRRSSPRSSAPRSSTGSRSRSSSCTAAPRPSRRRTSCSATTTARSRRTAPATA